LFDIDINNYVIVRWLCSFIMTNDPTTNQKSTRQPTTTPTTDDMINLKQSKIYSSKILPTINLMQFIENLPAKCSILPHPRSGHRAIATESDLWTWGGYYPAGGDDEPERMFQEVRPMHIFIVTFDSFKSSFGVIILPFIDGHLNKRQATDQHVLLLLIQVD
jgi:hypothetical protein